MTSDLPEAWVKIEAAPDDVEVIRSADARGVPQKDIAAVFNVSSSSISAIVRNQSWKES